MGDTIESGIDKLTDLSFPGTIDISPYHPPFSAALMAVEIAAMISGDWDGLRISNPRERDEYIAKLRQIGLHS